MKKVGTNCESHSGISMDGNRILDLLDEMEILFK